MLSEAQETEPVQTEASDTFTLVVGSQGAGKSSAVMNFLNPNKGQEQREGKRSDVTYR